MRLLVGKLQQGLLCDAHHAVDLEVELLAFSSQAVRFGAGEVTNLLRHAGELQQRAASVSFSEDPRYLAVLLDFRDSGSRGESRSCFEPAQRHFENYV